MQLNLSAVKKCGYFKDEDLKTASRTVVENPKLLSEGGAEPEGIFRRSDLQRDC